MILGHFSVGWVGAHHRVGYEEGETGFMTLFLFVHIHLRQTIFSVFGVGGEED